MFDCSSCMNGDKTNGQTRTVSSPDPGTILAPLVDTTKLQFVLDDAENVSGIILILRTSCMLCPRSTHISSPLSKSQTRTVLSKPYTILIPSGDMATLFGCRLNRSGCMGLIRLVTPRSRNRCQHGQNFGCVPGPSRTSSPHRRRSGRVSFGCVRQTNSEQQRGLRCPLSP